MSRLKLSGLIIVFVFSAIAAAARPEAAAPWPSGGEKVFDCQISFGEFQEVRIYKFEGEAYLMKTLNNAGSQHAYWMNDGEWPTKTLNIPCSRDKTASCGHVYVDSSNGEWMYDLRQNGSQNIGYCR